MIHSRALLVFRNKQINTESSIHIVDIIYCGQIDGIEHSLQIKFNTKLVLLWTIISLIMWVMEQSVWQFAEIINWFSRAHSCEPHDYGHNCRITFLCVSFFLCLSLSRSVWFHHYFIIYHHHHQFLFHFIVGILMIMHNIARQMQTSIDFGII